VTGLERVDVPADEQQQAVAAVQVTAVEADRRRVRVRGAGARKIGHGNQDAVATVSS
jgi:hypothetical protein